MDINPSPSSLKLADLIINSSYLKEKEKSLYKNDLKNLLSTYLTIKGKKTNNKEIKENIFSLNKAAISLNKNYFSQGNYNKEILVALDSTYMNDEEKNNKLVLTKIIEIFNKQYVNSQSNTNNFQIYLNDIITTTNKSLNKKRTEITETQGQDLTYKIQKIKSTTKLEDIAGLESQKEEIEIMNSMIQNPEIFKRNAIYENSGIIFYGPPGTGKTLLGKAMAGELNMNFVKIDVKDIVSKYFGESETILKQIFNEVRNNGKSILFFDELDAIAPARNNSYDSGAGRRIVNTLLSELDGFEDNTNIIPVGTTNEIGLIDKAILRSGRFTKHIYVPLPDLNTREKIWELYIKKSQEISKKYNGNGIFKDFLQKDYHSFSQLTEGWNGADINEALKEIKRRKAFNEIKTKKNYLIDHNLLIEGIKNFSTLKYSSTH